MPYDNSKAAVATGPDLRDSATESTLAALLQCLIVSAHGERRDLFRQAAIEGGWLPIVCDDVPSAREEAQRLVTPLVLADLYDDHQRRLRGISQWLESIATESGRLLAIVGGQEDPLEEGWARQLGAWLFLPGAGDAAGMAQVCSEAREAIARSSEPRATLPHGPRAVPGTRRRP